MAKGDKGRAEQGQQRLNEQLYGSQETFRNNYNTGVGMNLNSYDDIMRNYQSFYNNPMNPTQGYASLGNTQGGKDPQQYFQSLTQGLAPNSQSLLSIEKQLNEQGIKVLRNAEGIAGKVQLPNGHIVDVGRSFSSGNPGAMGWQWDSDNGIFGGGGGMGDPGYLSGLYRQLAEGGGGYEFDPEFRGALSNAIGGFNEFASTGGLSDRDRANIRARAISPIRAVYSNALQNLNRNRSLQPFSPNYAAATAKMAREQSYGVSDATTDAEAAIAEMVQQGRLAGLSGLTNASLGGQGAQSNIDELNARMRMYGMSGLQGQEDNLMNARLAALSGMTNLYGTTPALANTFGNQLLNNQGQLLQGQGLELEQSNIPSNYDTAINRIQQGMGLASQVAGALGGSSTPGAAGTVGKTAGMLGGASGATVPFAGANVALGTGIPSGALAGGTSATLAAPGAVGATSAGAGGGAGAGVLGALGTAAMYAGPAAAIAYGLYAHNQNKTVRDRESMASRLGYGSLAELNNYLGSLGPEGEEVRAFGEGQIGKRNYTQNKEWMIRMLQLIGREDLLPWAEYYGYSPSMFSGDFGNKMKAFFTASGMRDRALGGNG